ncbi:MAG: sugar kinase [Deltaproteobacteria bacterium]|nr:sugar kinase [Deltaproteobacteria bacterium]
MDLLCVGSVAYDDIETKFDKKENVLGGSATFASVAASFYCRPAIVGIVGSDFLPGDMEFLKSRGIDLTSLETGNGRTFHWKGRYHADMKGRDTLSTELNVFENFNPSLTEPARKSRIVFLGNIHPALQLKVLDQVKAPFLSAADTMNLWIDTRRELLELVLRRIDMLFINDEELHRLTGISDMGGAAYAILHEYGLKFLVVKLGANGSSLFPAGAGKPFHMPAIPVDVRDPTGAGDTFAGGVLGFICRSGDISVNGVREAMLSGTVLASFCVEGFGPGHLAQVLGEEMNSREAALRKSLSELER